ncbi:MAG: MarC family protein [Myxococcota bacterium]
MSPEAFGVLCFSSLFTVLDPLGVAPIFASMTEGTDPRRRRRAALRAGLSATIALVLFAAGGSYLLSLFGVTIEAFRIAGGVLLAFLGLSMLGTIRPHGAKAKTHEDPSVVPIGIPLIGGPGAMTTVMVLVGQAEGSTQLVMFGVALFLAMALTTLILLFTPTLLRRLGPAGVALVTKIMGLVVLVIGVQFMIDGISSVASNLG